MNQITSIVVTAQTDAGPQVFSVDVDKQCVLVWSDAGWDVLADYYDKVKHDPAKAKEVRERKCPKAKSKDGAVTLAAASEAVFALKSDECDPTQWP
jgi:hypothetical protein